MLTIGIDEAGRGALAGPVCVCAAAIIKPEAISHIQLNDSKKMTRAARIKEYRKIKAAAHAGVVKLVFSLVPHTYIDANNILRATCAGAADCFHHMLYSGYDSMGMVHAVKDEAVATATVMVDGGYDLLCTTGVDWGDYPAKVECVVKGDSKIPEIMMASIVAKCVRDEYMEAQDKEYPGYDFAKSKGYPSPKHMQAIIDKGPCEIHRKTFKRVKEYVN